MARLILQMVAPIAVGHRVRAIRYVSKTSMLKNFFTGPGPHGYVVTDLDTGIEYSPGRLWQTSGFGDEFIRLSELDTKVRADTTIQGTVTACRVISTVGNAGNHSIATQLTVQEDHTD